MRKRDQFDMKMPIFFKLWFAIIAFIMIAIFSFYGYIAYNAIALASDPTAIGEYARKISEGFSK